MRRGQKRLDYAQLHSSGDIVYKDEDTDLSKLFEEKLSIEENMTEAQLMIEINVLYSDIMDMMDENPINQYLDKIVISKIEELRSSYKQKNLQLQAIQGDNYQEDTFKKLLSMIKDYIKSCKDCMARKEMNDVMVKNSQTDREISFIIEDINRLMTELETIYLQDVKEFSDEKLGKYNKDLSTINKSYEKVSSKYQDLLKLSTSDESLKYEVTNALERYVKLNSLKCDFISCVDTEVNERELNKKKLFQESNLNIKIAKFSGYDSPVDIYTFQSEFEKVFLRTTPKCLLPDLLLNNYISEPALSLVKGLQDVDTIWKRLKESFGDTKILLSKKLNKITKLDPMSKTKDPSKLVYTLSKLINAIKDLIKLAKDHKIENRLYFGDGLQRIYKLMDESRVTRWIASICEEELDEKNQWERLLQFLEKEMKVQQQKTILSGGNKDESKEKDKGSSTKSRYGNSYVASSQGSNEELKCHICGGKSGDSEHVPTVGPGGVNIIHYFTCKVFANKNPAERLALLKERDLCHQCLFPGAKASLTKHKEGWCQYDYICKHSSHQRLTSNQKFTMRKHVLVCDDHKYNTENNKLLDCYKQRYISKNNKLPSFSRNIKLSFHTETHVGKAMVPDDNFNDVGIYLLQTILIEDQEFNVFYDNGCSDFIIKYDAAKRLRKSATQVFCGEINIGGVGNTQAKTKHGIYSVKIPLHDGGYASMSGICLEHITSQFPTYPLENVEHDIQSAFRSSGGDVTNLPKLSKTVGGEVDIMIGVKYLRYHPKPIYQLPSGLCIYESAFTNSHGGRGVLGGPHEVFTQIHQRFYNSSERDGFITHQHQMSQIGFKLDPDVTLLGFKSNNNISNGDHKSYHSRPNNSFQQVEECGSEIMYRCISCRECKVCKHHKETQAISIKEEVEQDMINKSVNINLEKKVITATLPFIQNPSLKLAPNKERALKVYNQQLRKLNNPLNIQDKLDIIESEDKLQQLGYVDYVKDLPADIRNKLENHKVQYFIPWRAVFKPGSVSTPCRIVFDASQATSSGFSLNDLLAKGINNLNRLQEILIRWSLHAVAITSDVKKMYNTIKLDEKDWCYQRYIWQKDLDPGEIPEEKVIKTLIYGVRSSGNQAEVGLRETAKLSESVYPEASNIINKDMYVDDCITGESCKDIAVKRSEELELVVNQGGFQLKGIAISGEDPPDTLSNDGSTVSVGGMNWYPKSDLVSLNVSELNFAKKNRGKKSSSSLNIIPEKLTRRHCASKVAEIFDIVGKITPITASMKLDLHELVVRGLNWDDTIPDDLRQLWHSNFELMQEINHLKFRRAAIPNDAVSLDINTIDAADASQSLACVTIYARFLRKNGEYSCQLVFSRSRLIPKGMSLPRAELYAALLNTHTGEIVKRSFNKWHQSSIKLTDSQITLHWITNDQKPLKEWVRNRVIEISRFTSKQQWFYVNTKDMSADIGTRRGATLSDVSNDSVWYNGFSWMKLDQSQFPIKSFKDLRISKEEKEEIEKESIIISNTTNFVSGINENFSDQLLQRYQFSKYLIDPNRYRFKKVVRILAIVIKFVKNLIYSFRNKSSKVSKDKVVLVITDAEIQAAEDYYFKKCTSEIKHFMPSKKYQEFTEEKDGILYYTGRILSTDDITVVGRFTNTMKDLASSTFCVPVVEKYSPVAYAITNEVHWHHKTAKHCGIETTLRFVLQTVYIIEGRSVVKNVKKSCERCRYLEKRTVAVAMGPVSEANLTIAPAFYLSQVDLAGPFMSYSSHHKRTTVKIWLIIFCCSTTSTTSIKVMEDYSTTSFIQAFTRFSCEVGYPKTLYCDEGSQLIKGCKEMVLNFRDLQHKLHVNVNVKFEVCSVGGHNEHGKVERKIKEIKISLEKSMHNERLSIMQWETIAAEVGNSINNLPLALGSITGNLESLDLITPNRLKLGRNNERSPIGTVVIASPSKMIKDNERIFQCWFETWLLGHVPKLMKQQKWFQTDDQVKIGDIVLFLKQDNPLVSDYRYGMVKEIDVSKDGVVRKVLVQYKNNNESTYRETFRSVRSIVVIHHVDETNIVKELGEIALKADIKMYIDSNKTD